MSKLGSDSSETKGVKNTFESEGALLAGADFKDAVVLFVLEGCLVTVGIVEVFDSCDDTAPEALEA